MSNMVLQCNEGGNFEPHPEGIHPAVCVDIMDLGLVETEFSLVRFKGDQAAADKVYEGLDPVTPDEVADCVMFALTRPLHVNLDEIVIKAIAQSSGSHVVRRST